MFYLLGIILILTVILLVLYYSGLYAITFYFAWLVIICTYIVLFFLIIHLYRVFFKGYAPYIRTSGELIKRVIGEIDFKEGASVYELGCGDGRFLRALAKQKNIRAVGFENFLPPYLLAQLFNLFSAKKIKIVFSDFFKKDLSQADYIFCYLLPRSMDVLEQKLQRELKPGVLVISNTFKFKNWPLEKEILLSGSKYSKLSSKIYLYRKI
ncbi:MAG: class I SAM-dependent methyltransferase [Candidatus Parcubacteria bacterium]|nr:class I SAM-dependent methyltransferase [Candidatus Parcubacteria bacterium]